MQQPQSLASQLAAMDGDSLRVLISGAGVAGTTLAQILRQHGRHPVQIEAKKQDADPGYMLGLMPMVASAVDEIGVRNAYRENSVEINRYGMRGRHGQRLREYSLAELVDEFGEYRGISRGELLDALTAGDSAVTFGVTVTGIDQRDDAVTVTFSTGERADFDVVAVAEGIHSSTREMVLSSGRVSEYDSRWGGWVVWIDPDDEPDLFEEVWGDGFFVGTYPVKDRIGAFVGGDRSDTRAGAASFVEGIRSELPDLEPRIQRTLDAVASADDAYYWSLVDVRAESWATGRVVLLGDAAAGFLPTAGIGAGMAMESAGQLAKHLMSASSTDIPKALLSYESAQKPRVESAQDNSRMLARLMFHKSTALAVIRDFVARFLTLKMALRPILKLLQTAP